MTSEAKKEKIITLIASRGWAPMDLYFNEAKQLRDAGFLKIGERFSVGGNRKTVWVPA